MDTIDHSMFSDPFKNVPSHYRRLETFLRSLQLNNQIGYDHDVMKAWGWFLSIVDINLDRNLANSVIELFELAERQHREMAALRKNLPAVMLMGALQTIQGCRDEYHSADNYVLLCYHVMDDLSVDDVQRLFDLQSNQEKSLLKLETMFSMNDEAERIPTIKWLSNHDSTGIITAGPIPFMRAYLIRKSRVVDWYDFLVPIKLTDFDKCVDRLSNDNQGLSDFKDQFGHPIKFRHIFLTDQVFRDVQAFRMSSQETDKKIVDHRINGRLGRLAHLLLERLTLSTDGHLTIIANGDITQTIEHIGSVLGVSIDASLLSP